MANKISLNVAGLNLIINTNEDEERVRRLTTVLNADMKNVMESNPSASVTSAAILCALDYLSQYDKANRSANNLRSQIKDYLSDAAKSKLEADDVARKNSELNTELQNLKERVTRMAANESNVSSNEENLKKQLEMARNDLNTMRRQLRDLVEQNASLQATINAQNESIASQSSDLARFTDMIKQQTAQLEQQNQLISDIKQSAVSIQEDRDGLLRQLEQQDKLLADLRQSLQDARNEKEFAAGKLESVNSEKAEVESMLNDAYSEIDQLKERAASAEAEVLALRNGMDAMREELEQVRKERADAIAVRDYFFRSDDEEELPAPGSMPAAEPEPGKETPTIPAPAEAEREVSEKYDLRNTSEFTPIDLSDEAIAGRMLSGPSFSFTPESEKKEETTDEPKPAPAAEAPAAPKKNYRFFDVEEGKVEDDSQEFGVGEGFKTFGQMIAEESHKAKLDTVSELLSSKAEKDIVSDDDLLPDLSWIDDID